MPFTSDGCFALVKRIFVNFIPVLFDAGSGFVGLYYLAIWWAVYHFHSDNYYSGWYIKIVIPSYIIIWLSSIFFCGGYKKPFNIYKALIGIVTGTALILVIYAVLPEYYRFSRLLIFFGTLWMLLSIILVRILLSISGKKEYHIIYKKKYKIAIVGLETESARVEKLLQQSLF